MKSRNPSPKSQGRGARRAGIVKETGRGKVDQIDTTDVPHRKGRAGYHKAGPNSPPGKGKSITYYQGPSEFKQTGRARSVGALRSPESGSGEPLGVLKDPRPAEEIIADIYSRR